MSAAAKPYDYIIIGAGSAGCVLARRLTEDPDIRVLVLEAGPMDHSLYMLRMPAALAEPLKSKRYNWAYFSTPEPHLDNRQVYYPRGRVVGGSSSINGMVYLRGNALDYEGWAKQQGLENWSYSHCLPYFKRMETSTLGPSDYRGGDGPVRVTVPECENPLFQAFLEAGEQAGYVRTDDVNGYRQEGFFRMERSTWNGVRSSAAKSYLHPARKTGQIDLKTMVRVNRILFDGNRAVGVQYLEDGNPKNVYAEREVILSAGAFNSPQLLKLSGIGPAAELRSHEIPVFKDMPGVGENLQDHLDYLVQYTCRKPVSFYPATKPINQLFIGMRWLLFKDGIGASNIWEAGSFFRSAAGVEFPNLQHHFAPVAISYDGFEKIESHGFQLHLSQMRPRSRGWVRLMSANPYDPPLARFNHLADADDRKEIRDGVRLTREIVQQAAFDDLRGEEIAPGPEALSDEALDAFGRAKAETSHHPSCTCKMGSDDMSVVDGEGRVHGLEGLRVVDASIMPEVVSSNINAPTIMMAEKIADRIRGKNPLPPDTAPFYRAENWRTSQR